jgi:hypothetical protein
MNGRLAGRLSAAPVRTDPATLYAALIPAIPRTSLVSGRRHSIGAERGLMRFPKSAFVAAFAATARSDATVLRK